MVEFIESRMVVTRAGEGRKEKLLLWPLKDKRQKKKKEKEFQIKMNLNLK